MTYIRWWHSLLISFSVVTWGLALPLYSFINENHRLETASGPAILLFMLIYHALPVIVVFLLDRILAFRRGRGIAHSSYRVIIFVGAAFVFLRALQIGGALPLAGPVESLPVGFILAVVAGLITAFAGLVVYFLRPVTLLFIYLSVASAILTGLFITQVGLLGEVWRDHSPELRPAQSVSGTGQTPVFLLVFDGLGNDVLLEGGNIDPNRFPNFALLGKDSAVFTKATSNYLTTWRSMTSFMTGALFSDQVDFQRDPSWSASDGILGALADLGYLVEFRSELFRCQKGSQQVCSGDIPTANADIHIAARDYIVWFLPKSVSRAGRNLTLALLPRQATLRIPFDTTHQNSRGFWDDFVARISASESPGRAYFVHLFLPHQPYEFDRDGARIRSLSAAQQFSDFPKTAEAYEEQVMFVDTLLGEFIAKLKGAGLYDRSLIIVTGDHGPRSLGLGHKFSGFDKSADFPDELNPIIPRVPLIIHGPQIASQVSAVEYQHIDLLPTLLDILGLPRRKNLPGVSAFASQRPDRDIVFYGIPNESQPGEQVTYTYNAETNRWHKADLIEAQEGY